MAPLSRGRVDFWKENWEGKLISTFNGITKGAGDRKSWRIEDWGLFSSAREFRICER